MIGTSKKILKVILKQISCIQYSAKFQKDQKTIQILINFGSEINKITLAYVAMLGLKVCPIAVRFQKIDGSSFKSFGIIIASF